MQRATHVNVREVVRRQLREHFLASERDVAVGSEAGEAIRSQSQRRVVDVHVRGRREVRVERDAEEPALAEIVGGDAGEWRVQKNTALYEAHRAVLLGDEDAIVGGDGGGGRAGELVGDDRLDEAGR